MSPVIRIEEDGTRVYSNYTRYKPKTFAERRKNSPGRPQDPRAVRFGSHWFLPLDLLEDTQRQMPVTRADTEAYDHMSKPHRCRCDVCRRPQAKEWKKQWRKDQRRLRKKELQMRNESSSSSTS